jgi:hypothetical protein
LPEKHHYFPIFYQKRWTSDRDGRVCVYSKPHRQVKALRRYPDQIGFRYDLYTIPGVEFETASHLERRFFLQTDNDAAQALSSMERDPRIALDNRLRSGWSRFVMSLIHRAPDEVSIFFREVTQHVGQAEREFEEHYAERRLPTDPETFEEFARARPANPAGIATAMLIQKVIDSRFVGNHFNRMTWTIISPPSAYTFLTSDRPIIMTNGLVNPDSHLALPIGPRRLFIASNQATIVREIAARKPDDLVAFVNDRVIKQARNFVIGVDDKQLRFVEKRFGARLPSSPTETAPRPTYEEVSALAAKLR